MLTFRPITARDRAVVIPMVLAFYQTDAVENPVDPAILERSFQALTDPEEPLLWGFLIEEAGNPAGYIYLTQCYSAEVGGRCIFIEEIFLTPQCRGRGLGRQVMDWLSRTYPQANRLRLEVTRDNQSAKVLYEKSGYRYLSYDQMVLDREH